MRSRKTMIETATASSSKTYITWLLGGFFCLASSSASAVITCNITSPPNINFGVYNPFLVGALNGVGTGTIVCSTNRASETVSLVITASAGSAGTFAPRRMNGPSGNTLAYYLYTDINRTRNFGTGASGTVDFRRRVTLRPSRTITQTVYGRITAGQDVAVGSYSDTLIYTVNF